MNSILQKNLLESISAKQALLEDSNNLYQFNLAASRIAEQYQSGGRLLIAGNGGSAADSQHLAAEFISKLNHDRNPIPAEALTVDTSVITAIGNDYGYDKIFSRQLKAKANPFDVFLGITTSGNSENIIDALHTCKEIGIVSVIFSGRDGGKALNLADYCVIAPGKYTSTIQETHILFAHTLVEIVETQLFNKTGQI